MKSIYFLYHEQIKGHCLVVVLIRTIWNLDIFRSGPNVSIFNFSLAYKFIIFYDIQSFYLPTNYLVVIFFLSFFTRLFFFHRRFKIVFTSSSSLLPHTNIFIFSFFFKFKSRGLLLLLIIIIRSMKKKGNYVIAKECGEIGGGEKGDNIGRRDTRKKVKREVDRFWDVSWYRWYQYRYQVLKN